MSAATAGPSRLIPLDLTLLTERLVLRPLAAADAPALATELSDLSVTRWLARVPHPYRLADARAFIEHVHLAAVAGTAVTFGIALRGAADRRIVGVVALHGLDGVPEFGYWLGRAWWGRGLMTEAVAAALAAIDERVAPEIIVSGAFVGNEASLAIQARFGFVRTGRSRRPCLARGGLVDHIDTRLTRAGYRAAMGSSVRP